MTQGNHQLVIFRACITRDGEALAWDWMPYFEMHRFQEEIRFPDGLWMLVRDDDLVAGSIGLPVRHRMD